ncbi:MAG TPA: LamG-like jellyroll fold domain-containing protein, partial [Candidatus Sulfotelmatobacter sp.]|nr:LamG-like jellyroll fold domain-containing protein [Candidatus Sulfotelmatobacter sp.]
LLGLLLLGLAVTERASSSDCEPAPKGLVSWWPGDGGAQDVAGSSSGTLQAGATATASGLVGSAFSFDGTNQYVQIPNTPGLCPSKLTLEAWVYFEDLDSSSSDGVPPGQQFIIFKQNSRESYFEGYDLSKTRIGDQDVFSFTVSAAGGETMEVLGRTLIRAGVWYHVAAVRSSDSVQLYVNGQLEGQGAVDFEQDYGDFPLYFGTSGQAYWDAKLKGRLDEVALYDRALSAKEIQALFAAGGAGKCKGPIILTQPQSQTVAAGHNALLWVDVSGSPPLAYQWRCNGTNLTGATNTSLPLDNIQSLQVGTYTVLVSNLAGITLSVPATVIVFTSGSQEFLSDPNLSRAVAAALGKGTEPVTESDLLDLTCLTACGQHITNLSGLEYASNLTCLILSANGVEDLTPLSQLHGLTHVALDRNRISSLLPLISLSSLTNLNLSDNLIGDGQPLASLTGLISLSLNGNSLSNLTFLQPLSQLRSLELGSNPITDLSTLASLTSLEALTLSGNPQIPNFTVLSGLSRLSSLSLRECSLRSLCVLKNLEPLRFLDLY